MFAGTGTFGRVRLARHKASRKYFALKILKKSEVLCVSGAHARLQTCYVTCFYVIFQIIRLKQVDHIKSEVVILSMLSHPFIVNMYVPGVASYGAARTL